MLGALIRRVPMVSMMLGKLPGYNFTFEGETGFFSRSEKSCLVFTFTKKLVSNFDSQNGGWLHPVSIRGTCH
jgi:hypothetical protein